MADPVTTNIQLAVPTHGSDVDTWDQPLNNNSSIIDSCFGGVTSISATSGTVNLSVSDAQASIISFSGTLTGIVTVNFPIQKSWCINNLTVMGSSFAINLVAPSGTNVISAPPGVCTIYADGTVMRYLDLGYRIGAYFDYAGSTVPTWITQCTVPPFLNCTGAGFSSSTYPILASILGGTTLPDLRGALRATLNQGTGRITTAGSGINGDALLSRGGSEFQQAHIHSYSGTTGGMNANNPHNHSYSLPGGSTSYQPASTTFALNQFSGTTTTNPTDIEHGHAYSGVTNVVGAGNSQNMPPTTISGITMIRAA